MERRSISDLSSGVALTLFGLYVTVVAARWDYLTEDGPGPGFLPFWLGLGICALALCLIGLNRLRPVQKVHRDRQSWFAARRAISGWLGLMTAIVLFPFVGFTICLVLLTVFIITFMEQRPFWSAGIIALALGIGFHLIFIVLLGLSFPRGPFGF
jgi:putative tricarboxylic transport membrane protein